VVGVLGVCGGGGVGGVGGVERWWAECQYRGERRR